MAGARIVGRRLLAVLAVVLAAVCAWVWTRSAATVRRASTPVLKVDLKHPGGVFAPGAVGFSTEALELGRGRLTAHFPGLVRLMRLLGPAVLRIGGNSVDASWWTSHAERPPNWATNTVTPVDLSALQGLLSATGWRVLLGVDLGHFEPARAADEARIAKQILGPDLLGVEIGNEPNDFGHAQFGLRPTAYGPGQYLSQAGAYSQALAAAAPGVPVFGPATTQKSNWLEQIGSAGQMFAAITQHYYGTSTCPGPPPAVPPTVGGLLSPAERQLEGEILAVLARGGGAAKRPVWIGETNDTACMASPAVSPVFASALWALDWALRAASAGAQEIDFHGNLTGVCGASPESPICAPSDQAAHTGELAAQPEYYGLLAAARLEGGRFVPTRVISRQPLPNFTSWATVAANGTVRIALDNLSTTGPAQAVSIPVSGYATTEQRLLAGSAKATGGVGLGGAGVTARGWRPRSERARRHRRTLRVVVSPASAVVVTLRRERRR